MIKLKIEVYTFLLKSFASYFERQPLLLMVMYKNDDFYRVLCTF